VELGDDGKYPVTGLGSISFRMPPREVLELHEVLYVLGMTKNLLSVSCLTDLKCRVEFDDQEVIIRSHSLDPGRVLAGGVREGGLYRLLADPMKQRTLLTSNDNLCELWHRRFGHLNYGSLPLSKDMVVGFPNFKVEKRGVCKGCALDKHAKVAFPSSEHKSRGILDLIHLDVYGPMSSASLTSNLYYVTFIDDSSKKPGYIL
jgi:hypothetical protein